MKKTWPIAVLAASSAIFSLTGCTVFGEKNPPTLKTTTSAEQYERIFWQQVKSKDWVHVPGMLAENVEYGADGKLLSKDQVVPYLQAAAISDFAITNMVVKPNGPDMTLSYTLQVSSSTGQRTVTVISVWQQVAKGYVLIVQTEQPQIPAS